MGDQTTESAREDGIRAYIALQSLNGIVESRTTAERGWDALTTGDQERTMAAFKTVEKMREDPRSRL